MSSMFGHLKCVIDMLSTAITKLLAGDRSEF